MTKDGVNNQKKVIVVDDDPDILEALQAMLEDEWYFVLTTEKGEYLEQLHNGRLPDLILLDMLLSGKDGRDIARFLRRQEETKHIPIVMMSAHPGAEPAALAAGATDFIAKPFEMDALLAIVAKYL